MKKKNGAALEQQLASCRRELSQIGYISQGSVQDRTARTGGGAGYQWTRKVRGKTVTVALNQEQYRAMKEAVSNRRRLDGMIRKMEKLSRQILFEKHPNPNRRKHLSNKVLGLN